jgi:hypothetical protein
VARVGVKAVVHRVFSGGNLSDKRPLGRLGRRKNDGINFSLNKACITS